MKDLMHNENEAARLITGLVAVKVKDLFEEE